jgi:translocation and assembly module TamB
VQDTLLDLKANDVELVNGMALLNDRAIPFDLAARDLNAQVNYLKATDRYGIAVGLSDLRTKMGKQAEAQSRLRVQAELGRDVAQLRSLEFDSGKASVLRATGTLNHFAQPEWQAAVNGTLELTQLSVLADVDGLTAGTMELKVNGHSCAVSPVAAQTHPRFWQRTRPATPAKPGRRRCRLTQSARRVICWWARRSCTRRATRTRMCGCTMSRAERSCMSRRRSCCLRR